MTRAVAVLAATALAAPSAASAAPREEPAPAPPAAVESLNHPGVESHWAFVAFRTRVRAAPDPSSRVVGRLGLRTEDGTDELVLVLERRSSPGGRPWLRVRLPVLPNGRTGWVPEDALGALRRVRTWLIVDRRRFVARLIRSGRVVFRARIGVGKRRSPTPGGQFYVRNRLTGFGEGTIYGALAYGTSAKSAVLTDWPGGGVIGIHGTNQPELIPGRISNGCIRMRNRDILRLARLMPVGTPLTIR